MSGVDLRGSRSTLMAFAAEKPGSPGFCAFLIDKPQYAEKNSIELSQWESTGLRLHYVPAQEAALGFQAFALATVAAKEAGALK